MSDQQTFQGAGEGSGAVVVIGLTGPIGCGKTTVATMLAELGGVSIDADALAREVTTPGRPELGAIRARFGDAVFDGTGALDRAALGAIVFEDEAALRDLEAIVHPGVRALVEQRLAMAVRDGDPFVAVEAIKLVEGGLATRCDEVWLIECPPLVQRERLAGRGMTESDMERRLSTQGADLADRLAAHAHRRIDTSLPMNQLRERVEDALAEVLAPRFGPLFGPLER